LPPRAAPLEAAPSFALALASAFSFAFAFASAAAAAMAEGGLASGAMSKATTSHPLRCSSCAQ
jgi:hypothetical protein